MSTYNSAKNRQSETKSSAWSFLLVGCIGFLVIALALLGVIRLPFGTFSLVIMEVMFVIFLIIAGISFKKAMNMLDEISKETDLEALIKEWAKENLTVDSLTVDVDVSTTEEMKYFMVTELIRERIMHAFPEVEESYADELTENFYNELFS